MHTSTRIESISPVGFLDMFQSVHVTKLLESCEQSSDSWSGDSEVTWVEGNSLPDPNTGPCLELPWASDCWGRILATFQHWEISWSIEESGVLVAPVYWDGQQAHLVKATLAPSSTTSLDDYWRWIAELKAHCHILHAARGVLHVCHAGDLDHDHDPIAMAYEFEFTPQEIDHLWKLLLTLRKTYRLPLQPKNVPSGSVQP